MTAEAYMERVETERTAQHEARRRWWTAFAVAFTAHAAFVAAVVTVIWRIRA